MVRSVVNMRVNTNVGSLGKPVTEQMLLSHRRVGDVTEGQKTIPFAIELETGKWMYDSDK